MASKADLQPVFKQLRVVMQKYATDLQVIKDSDGHYSLNGDYSEQCKKVIWFGGVKRMKNYVSYHLIAVYAFPEVRAELSPDLQQRMQGKSCFNFTRLDEPLLDELSRVTARSVQVFRKAKWLSSK
jgi:hypothetical protein